MNLVLVQPWRRRRRCRRVVHGFDTFSVSAPSPVWCCWGSSPCCAGSRNAYGPLHAPRLLELEAACWQGLAVGGNWPVTAGRSVRRRVHGNLNSCYIPTIIHEGMPTSSESNPEGGGDCD